MSCRRSLTPALLALILTAPAVLACLVAPPAAASDGAWADLGIPATPMTTMAWNAAHHRFLLAPSTNFTGWPQTFWTLRPDSGWRRLDLVGIPDDSHLFVGPVPDARGRLLFGTVENSVTDTVMTLWVVEAGPPARWRVIGSTPYSAHVPLQWIPDADGEHIGALYDSSNTYPNTTYLLRTWSPTDSSTFVRRRTLPPALEGFAPIPDIRRSRVIAIQMPQSAAGPVVVETTSIDGSDGWQVASPAGTPPTGQPETSFLPDPARDRLLEFVTQDWATSQLWAYDLADPGRWTLLATLPCTVPTAAIGIAGDTLWVGCVSDSSGQLGGRTLAIPLLDPAHWRVALDPAWPGQARFDVMLRDEAHDRWLLAGGTDRRSRPIALDSLLTLRVDGDAPTWTHRAIAGAAPTTRVNAAWTLDPGAGVAWMLGGTDGSSFVPTPYNDLWKLHLDEAPRWEAVPAAGTGPTAPGAAPSAWPVFQFDPSSRRLIWFTSLNDTVWTLAVDGANEWHFEVPSGTPPPGFVSGATATYDPTHDRIVFIDNEGQPWTLSLRPGLEWRPGPPYWAFANAVGARLRTVFDPVGARVLVVNAPTDEFGLVNGIWAIDAGDTLGEPYAIQPTWPTSLPAGAPAAYDPAGDALLVFGEDYRGSRLQRLAFDRGATVPTRVVVASAAGDHVALRWAAAPGASFLLSRSVNGAAWTYLATLVADAGGALAYDDRAIEAGTRYGYRLATPAAPSTPVAADAWVTAPAAATFALGAAWPNPAHRAMNVAFSLAAPGRTTLELFDVAGRRVESRALDALGPGPHHTTLDAPGARSGLYLLRLTQGGAHRTTRVVFVR